MEPISLLLGAATFSLAARLKKPIRKVAVVTTSQILALTDRLRTTAYSFKEEVEDIIAEAHYENMKKNMESADNPDNSALQKLENGEGNERKE